jgi:hypothetical protein
MLRIDGALRKFDAPAVLEISKGNDVCAATTEETTVWLTSLTNAKKRISADSQATLDAIRARMTRDQKLTADVLALKTSLDVAYGEGQENIKDAIKVILDFFTVDAAPMERAVEAVKSHGLSKAIGNGALSFGVDAATVVVKKAGVAPIARGLSVLTIKELVAECGAQAAAAKWLKPSFDHLVDIAKNVDEAAARSLLQNAQEYAATMATADFILSVVDIQIKRTAKYLDDSRSKFAGFDGKWDSADGDRRFRLECADQSCDWIERSKAGSQLRRRATLAPTGAFGHARIERANDTEVLIFLGFQPSLRAEILARSPRPSFMNLTVGADGISAQWYGLSVKKNAQAKLEQLYQPGAKPPAAYSFVRAP